MNGHQNLKRLSGTGDTRVHIPGYTRYRVLQDATSYPPHVLKLESVVGWRSCLPNGGAYDAVVSFIGTMDACRKINKI